MNLILQNHTVRHSIFVYVGRSVSVKLDLVSTMLFYVFFLRIFDDTEKNTGNSLGSCLTAFNPRTRLEKGIFLQCRLIIIRFSNQIQFNSSTNMGFYF